MDILCWPNVFISLASCLSSRIDRVNLVLRHSVFRFSTEMEMLRGEWMTSRSFFFSWNGERITPHSPLPTLQQKWAQYNINIAPRGIRICNHHVHIICISSTYILKWRRHIWFNIYCLFYLKNIIIKLKGSCDIFHFFKFHSHVFDTELKIT